MPNNVSFFAINADDVPRARKFYGASWSSGIEEGDFFARHYQATRGGTVVASPKRPKLRTFSGIIVRLAEMGIAGDPPLVG